LIFPADAVYTRTNYGPPPRASGIVYDSLSYFKSIEKIRNLEKIHKAKVMFSHDMPFFEKMKKEVPDIHIIRGNHDGNLLPMLPSAIKLHPSTGINLNTVGFFHGHTWPAKGLLNSRTLVMGHVHPTITFSDPLGFKTVARVWIKAGTSPEKLAMAYLKAKKGRTAENVLTAVKENFDVEPQVRQIHIMPCFNSFLGGHPLNRKSPHKRPAGPILRSGAIDIAEAEAYLLDGTFLGAIEKLRELN
jgi:metallophosphoesterase superfamily enzyme